MVMVVVVVVVVLVVVVVVVVPVLNNAAAVVAGAGWSSRRPSLLEAQTGSARSGVRRRFTPLVRRREGLYTYSGEVGGGCQHRLVESFEVRL
ncbi:hypothetical protein ElyMa_000279100 [Elysia marginata]|uniref:Secreted protein n=1 Tax=Elysia marginata TaxID=1093978 RepID=A0AAV4F5C6_9GAST|nr:hypothetical protein ElyMa_000279100 [Elysia marginata]